MKKQISVQDGQSAVKVTMRQRTSGIFPVLILVLLLFSGCAAKEKDVVTASTEEERVYYPDLEGKKIAGVPYTLSATTKEGQIEELLLALEQEPRQEGYRSAKPENLKIQSYTLSSNEVLTLYFDTGYQQISGTDEVLMRAAIVKTLCRIEGVNAVEFYVGGQPLLRTNGKPVGRMKAEDFIDNTGASTEFYQKVYVSVYYANEAGDALVVSDLKITYDGTISVEQLIISQLLAGPIEAGMKAALPAGTVLNKVAVKDGICYVDFNEKFLEKRSDVSEEVTIYSVVNSLAELTNVYKVQFTINGETKKMYHTLEFSGAFERNLEIIDGDQ